MNWYKKFDIFKVSNFNKLNKIRFNKFSSGVEGFMKGLINKKIEDYPPENELTQSEIDEIRRLSSADYISPIDKTKYFLKYPNLVYYGFYNFYQYCEWKFNNSGWTDEAQLVWDTFKKHDNKVMTYCMSGMNDIVYHDILKYFKITELCVSNIFNETSIKDYKKYPEFFLDSLKERYPKIYSSMFKSNEKDKLKIVFDYISFPSSLNHASLSALCQSEKSGSNNSFFKNAYSFLLDFHESNSNFIELSKNMDNHPTLDGTALSLYREISKFLEATKNNENFISEDSPFSNLNYKSSFGDINICKFGQYTIPRDSLKEMLSDLGSKPSDEYYSIFVDYPDNGELSLYLKNEEDDIENAKIFSKALNKVESDNDYSSRSIVEVINTELHIDRKTKPEMFLKWFKNKSSSSKNKDLFYLDFLNNPILEKITEKASSDLFGTIVYNYEEIDLSFYNEDKEYHWNVVLPFELNVAKEIWSEIPIYIRAKADKVPTWFYLCSGLFPCSNVLNKSLQYPSDALKVLSGISCVGGNSEKIKEQIRTKGKDLERQSKTLVRDNWDKFLKDTNQRSYHLYDFPRLYDFTQKLTDRIVGNEEVYSPDVGKYISSKTFAKDKLNQMIIYTISSNKLIDYFGIDALDASGYSPNKSNGIFCPRFTLSSDNDSIIIFIDKLNSIDKIKEALVDIIGLEPETFLPSIGEEGTLWHEVAHAVVERVVPGISYKNEGGDETSNWLQDPDELIAIQYGQLRYIWDRLYRFFDSQIPVNEAITEGLISHIKEDVIEVLSWEFQGMKKSDALAAVSECMEDFEAELRENDAMSHSEKINLLTDLFTEFYMRQFMRGKVESEIDRIRNEVGNNSEEKINYKDEYPVPEVYTEPIDIKDMDISELEKEDDYILFFKNVQVKIDRILNRNKLLPMDYKRYVYRYDNRVVKKPWKFDDLLQFIYEPHMFISDVNLSSKNQEFGYLVPSSLKSKVEKIVLDKKKILSLQYKEDRDKNIKPVSPDEAEDAGKFMAEMDRKYGEDWMWLANSWYKMYKLSSNQIEPLYHISNHKFSKFDTYMSAQGIIWFSRDLQSLSEDYYGASINNSKPIYLYECSAKVNKTAGWDEYERYGIWELQNLRYDSISLDSNFVVFNPNNISILETKVLKK